MLCSTCLKVKVRPVLKELLSVKPIWRKQEMGVTHMNWQQIMHYTECKVLFTHITELTEQLKHQTNV